MKKTIRKVCIVGAGALGLSTAYYLKKLFPEKNYLIDVIEASDSVGGLAKVFKLSNGEKIESYYHHIFKSDKYFINLSITILLDGVFCAYFELLLEQHAYKFVLLLGQNGLKEVGQILNLLHYLAYV